MQVNHLLKEQSLFKITRPMKLVIKIRTSYSLCKCLAATDFFSKNRETL